jgi:hypothetical protein
MTTIYAGWDIAKINLQLPLAGRCHDLPNPATGHRRLVKRLAPQLGVHIVCEATGGYERDLVAALPGAAVPVSVLNPARVRPFARATGQRAKTDPIDAAVLTAFGQTLQPKPTAPRTDQQQPLAELVRRRGQVLEILVAQRQQAQRLTVSALRRQAQSLVRRLERDLERIEEQLKALRSQAAALDAQVQKLEAITGVGTLPPWACWPNCLNWACSTGVKPPRWPGWPPIHEQAVNGTDAEASEADGLRFAAPFTWPHWLPPTPTTNSRNFTSGCRQQANRPKSPSPPSCVN